MQRRGVERVIAKALQTLPVGFRVARQNASFTNLGHEPDHWRCPQFGRYQGERWGNRPAQLVDKLKNFGCCASG